MWKFRLWRPMSQAVALSNARQGATALARRRVEREEADIFVARLDEAGKRGARHSSSKLGRAPAEGVRRRSSAPLVAAGVRTSLRRHGS